MRIHRLLYFQGSDALLDDLLVINLLHLLLLLNCVTESLSNLIGDIVICEHGLRGIQLVPRGLLFVWVDLRVDHRVSELVGVMRVPGHVHIMVSS